MAALVRRVSQEALQFAEAPASPTQEWLVTNGLGGYASGTIVGAVTRRYHGLLVAALPAPRGRWVVFSHLSERLRLPDGTLAKLSGEQRRPGEADSFGMEHLVEFRLEEGLPVWQFQVADVTIEKRIVLPHGQNAVHILYRLVEGDGPVRLKLLPSLHSRSHDAPVNTPLPEPFRLAEMNSRYEISVADLPTLRLMVHGRRQAFTIERKTLPEVDYPLEDQRGYEQMGSLWSPGYFRVDLMQDEPAALVASTEEWNVVEALAPEEALDAERERRAQLLAAAPEEARDGIAAELALAADQFIIRPVGRTMDAIRAHAEGEDVRSVIAGYHWFTDWGRDTMISLEGLTLTTGRFSEAGYILRTFSHFIRDGLLPNMFPEGEQEGLYHTADATMWFFHAIDRYLELTGDRSMLQRLLPRLLDIAEHHLQGTRFGIGVDSQDGLLRQGQEGYQLTWMDAKVGDWVVTPRRGKAVEINALWYNALCLLADWVGSLQGEEKADVWRQHAAKARQSFNKRFWNESAGHLYDAVDGPSGDDDACRPNQILAISTRYPVLEQKYWKPVLEVVRERLLTPVGLRSLDSSHSDYQAKYYGDIYARDAAYHQGTVWGWLIGPFVDAWLKVYPDDRAGARKLLAGFETHLNEACIGSISEIFDAAPPFTPRGCVAQAWSVAEVLRCWLKAAEAR